MTSIVQAGSVRLGRSPQKFPTPKFTWTLHIRYLPKTLRHSFSVEVLDLYCGELPGEFTFFLPEGSLPWVQEDVLFRDLAGLPKPVPGETALVFFRSGNWLVTPFTHGESGYWRVVQVDGEQYLCTRYLAGC